MICQSAGTVPRSIPMIRIGIASLLKSAIFVAIGLPWCARAVEIPVAGEWRVYLEQPRKPDCRFQPPLDVYASAPKTRLPGTLDEAGIGNGGADDGGTSRLSRRVSFSGRAWYHRRIEIPPDASGKELHLTMERTKFSKVWLDNTWIGEQRRLCVPHRYVIPGGLAKPGAHTLTILIDNDPLNGNPGFTFNAHQNSDQTQTNWNGIIGDLVLSTDPRPPAALTGQTSFKAEGTHFTDGGKRVFLRGKHDACVFPLLGHAPMDTATWEKYLGTVRSYGFNHLRFHSWCPPKAAFEAADILGIYLQPELPIWGRFPADENHPDFKFLLDEGAAILREYGNHKSFRMFCLGNELSADPAGMRMLVDRFRAIAPDKLYTFAAWPHLGGLGAPEGEDYMISARIGRRDDKTGFSNNTRGSFAHVDNRDGGIINAETPNTDRDFSGGVLLGGKPVLGHETGQFQFYPDARELPRYTGVLAPRNLERLLDRAHKIHGRARVEEFFRAVGPLAVQCYKEEFEMARRTPDMAGFQTLDLQDFPGQGTALVGPLNAFMENKGFVTREEFLAFNGDIVPLARFPKFAWLSGETFTARVAVSNYSASNLDTELVWSLTDNRGAPVRDGRIRARIPQGAVRDAGSITIPLGFVKQPGRYTLAMRLPGMALPNIWPLWIYPGVPDSAFKPAGSVRVFSRPDDRMFETLRDGGKAVLFAEEHAFPKQTVTQGLFIPCFWNYSMFNGIAGGKPDRTSPGTLGLLIRPDHPALAGFPTEFHSNWQWWPVMKFAEPLILDGVKQLRPIVEPIDNVERCHRLGLLFEIRVGPGRLLVCMADLPKAISNGFRGQNEIRQLYASIMTYANGPKFDPAESLTEDETKSLFSASSAPSNPKGVENQSY